MGLCICRTQPCENKFASNYINIRVCSFNMFQKTFIVQLTDLCPLSMYAFVHVCTILTLGRSINLYMQGFPRSKRMMFCMAMYHCMNIQDLLKCLLTSVLQRIPGVANPFLFAKFKFK